MPPNRHNTSSTISSGHRKQSKLKPSRQDCELSKALSLFPGFGSIFLLNFDPSYRERLAILFRGLRYKVFVPEEHAVSFQHLNDKQFRQADLVLFDLTRINHDDVWVPLRCICRLRKPDGMPLMVHCFSRVYRGPEFHLFVEKLGARFDYYAE